jgi:hypothetical protein
MLRCLVKHWDKPTFFYLPPFPNSFEEKQVSETQSYKYRNMRLKEVAQNTAAEEARVLKYTSKFKIRI